MYLYKYSGGKVIEGTENINYLLSLNSVDSSPITAWTAEGLINELKKLDPGEIITIDGDGEDVYLCYDRYQKLTNEQLEARKTRMDKEKAEEQEARKQRRYNTYLELKKEFESNG